MVVLIISSVPMNALFAIFLLKSMVGGTMRISVKVSHENDDWSGRKLTDQIISVGFSKIPASSLRPIKIVFN